MNPNSKNEYKICIWGATVSKVEANRIGLAIIIGICCAAILHFVLGFKQKEFTLLSSIALAGFAYFWVARILVKDKG